MVGSASAPRRVEGALVNALATKVTSLAECNRLFGSNAKVKRVDGVVLEVIVNRPLSGRTSTSLKMRWSMPDSEKITVLKLSLIKAGHKVSNNSSALESINPIAPDGNACFYSHGLKWIEEDVTRPLGGTLPRLCWSLLLLDGTRLIEGSALNDKSLVDIFTAMFPMDYMPSIVDWTSKKLDEIAQPGTSSQEVLKFFGVLVLMTRFEFGDRRSLWSRTRSSMYIPAACLGETRMSRNRFEYMLRCITFGNCTVDRDNMASSEHRWQLVDGFVDAFNRHRERTFQPTE